MKKLLPILFLISLFFSNTVNSQNAVEDALKLQQLAVYPPGLNQWIFPDTASEVYTILANYDADLVGKNDNTQSDVVSEYSQSNNPYICGSCMVMLQDPAGFSANEFNTGSGILSSIGGLDVTNIADGLAKFLVKRTKEELNTAFFTKFDEALDKHPEFQELFPNTYAVFQLIGDQVYQINAYLTALRAAYIQDFKTLPGHLSTYLKSPQNQDIFKQKWMRYLIPDLLTATQMGIDGTNAVTIINYLGDDMNFDSAGVPGLSGAMQTLQLLTNAMVSSDSSRTFVSATQIKELFTKEPALNIFLGLLYQMDGGNIKYVTKDTTTTLRQILSNKDIQLGLQLKQHLYNFVTLGNTLDGYIKQLETDTSLTGSNRYEVFYNAVNTMIEIVNEGFAVRSTLTGQAMTEEETKVLRVFQLFNEIFLDVRLNNYSSVIVKVTELLDLLLQDSHFKFKDALLKFGSFMAAMATADGSDEVAQIIEAYTLPAGSSTVKKYSKFNMSLQSYVGAFLGVEELTDVEGNPRKETVAVSAPLGIAASWGFKDGNGALSIYGSLVDLGAMTAFRFSDTTTTDLPKIKLKNLFAPGVFLVYGLPKNLPVSIGAGLQVSPSLREVTSTANSFESGVVRAGIFISVDIPLLNLANVPRSD